MGYVQMMIADFQARIAANPILCEGTYKLRVLVACEESQAVTKELRLMGHDAFSCDILPCSGGHPEWHLQQDVAILLKEKWDMIIAFPPCTHLSSSGQWAYTKGIKPLSIKNEAIDFFMKFVNADCDKIAIENPIGIMSTHYRKPDQIIHPWMFGHKASKSTCLWLKGMPKLIPISNVKPDFEYHEWIDKKTGATKRMEKWMYDIRTKPHKQRSDLASKTFKGIAVEMAKQWAGSAFT